MPRGPTADDRATSEQDAVSFDTFSGLRNTIAPERLGPRELAEGVNVDIDDAGQVRRRRGYRKALIGRFHSFWPYCDNAALVVQNSMLVRVDRDYATTPLLAGIGPSPLSYARVGGTLYGSSETNSFQIDADTLRVAPWGLVLDRSNYQPGLQPAPSDWWYSPIAVPEPDAGLGPVRGKLLGPPPLGSHLAVLNGRIYLAAGRTLWATELYLYDYVDKTRGYRQFEDDITGLCAVVDGLYVGTRNGLYFIDGIFDEGKRRMKDAGGVIPGTMINVPGDVISPLGRRNPDIPETGSVAMACMTTTGQVVGLSSGDTYNLTRNQFAFPASARGAAMYREQDGIKQVVTTLDSGGTPVTDARFSDYCDARLIRAFDATSGEFPRHPAQPASTPPAPSPSPSPAAPAEVEEYAQLVGLDGQVLGGLIQPEND